MSNKYELEKDLKYYVRLFKIYLLIISFIIGALIYGLIYDYLNEFKLNYNYYILLFIAGFIGVKNIKRVNSNINNICKEISIILNEELEKLKEGENNE